MSSSVSVPSSTTSGPRSSSGSFGSGGGGGRYLRSKVGDGGAATGASGPGETEGGLKMITPLDGAGSEGDLVGPRGGRGTIFGGRPKSTRRNW